MADQGRMVKTWFAKASRDLRTAKLLLAQDNEDFWESKVFHAQQTAEKSIKGFLAFNKIRLGVPSDVDVVGFWKKMGFEFNGKTHDWVGKQKTTTVREFEKDLNLKRL